MHYYKRNLGDYAKKAGRLTILQHGVYNLLIDACYDREQFPTLEEAMEWVWACSEEEKEAVKFVLSRFFVEQEDGTWLQKRINETITEYHGMCQNNKRIATEREEKRTKRARSVDEAPPNHKPLTTNQEPSTSKNKFSEGDFALAERISEKVLDVVPRSKPPNLESWANDIRLMREQDSLSFNEIWSVFLFANSDGFWRTNILSTKKLREKFPMLHAKHLEATPNQQSDYMPTL